MIKPVVQDAAFLADVLAARQEEHHVHLWWLGQSGFLVQWSNHHLLLDPYEMFEFNTVTPDEFGAAARQLDQPHRLLRCGERWTSRELK